MSVQVPTSWLQLLRWEHSRATQIGFEESGKAGISVYLSRHSWGNCRSLGEDPCPALGCYQQGWWRKLCRQMDLDSPLSYPGSECGCKGPRTSHLPQWKCVGALRAQVHQVQWVGIRWPGACAPKDQEQPHFNAHQHSHLREGWQGLGRRHAPWRPVFLPP